MTAIYMLWLRSVKRYLRSRAQIITSLTQPLLYLIVLGFGLGAVFEEAGRGSYLQFVAPGVVGMTVLFTAMFWGANILWDRQFGFLKQTLVAPVPRLYILIGHTLGGATIAMLQGTLLLAFCLLAGFRPTYRASLPLALASVALIAVTFNALGTLIGSSLRDAESFHGVVNFLITPIFFFSGALFPLENIPPALAVVTRLDPMTYGIDGLRGALTGIRHFGGLTDLVVLGGLALVFLALGTRALSRIQV
jgi:ABC-2 type transport system permease protein